MQIGLEPPYLIVKPGLSEEDFYRLADEDSNWEYLDGRILMHSPASDRHEDLFRFLLTLFSGFLDERGGAIVRGSRFPMRLDARWSPESDLFVLSDSSRSRLTERRLEGPADLVVEIVSDSDPTLDHREKLPRYREAGIERSGLSILSAGGTARDPDGLGIPERDARVRPARVRRRPGILDRGVRAVAGEAPVYARLPAPHSDVRLSVREARRTGDGLVPGV